MNGDERIYLEMQHDMEMGRAIVDYFTDKMTWSVLSAVKEKYTKFMEQFYSSEMVVTRLGHLQAAAFQVATKISQPHRPPRDIWVQVMSQKLQN